MYALTHRRTRTQIQQVAQLSLMNPRDALHHGKRAKF